MTSFSLGRLTNADGDYSHRCMSFEICSSPENNRSHLINKITQSKLNPKQALAFARQLGLVEQLEKPGSPHKGTE